MVNANVCVCVVLMCLQVNTAKSHEEACEYRKRLVQFMMSHGVRRVDSACSICLEPFDMQVRGTCMSEEESGHACTCIHGAGSALVTESDMCDYWEVERNQKIIVTRRESRRGT